MARYEVRRYADNEVRVCDTFNEFLGPLCASYDIPTIEDVDRMHWFLTGDDEDDRNCFEEHAGEPYEVVTL